jgi:PKD repeat protein
LALAALALTASLVVSVAPDLSEPAGAVSPGSHLNRVVAETSPASWTPHVLDGYVRTFAEAGDIVLAGGNFSTVTGPNGGAQLARDNIVAFEKGTGAILGSFNPSLNGEVFEILPTGDGQTVYVVGGFTSWNGQNVSRIIKVNATTGQRVAAFSPPGFNGRIHDAALSGDRLYVMGRFTTISGQPHTLVAALNPSTGTLIPEVKIDIAVPRPNRPDGFLTVASGDVTPDGSRMVIIGNFTEIAGQPRYQIGMLDLTTTPISVANWQTNEYNDSCASVFDTYMRDVEISPDGSHFVVVTTGAFAGGHPAGGNQGAGTLCDTAARWDFSQTGSGLLPTWVNWTGGDTLLSTAVTESVAYLGGHQRWQNNPFAGDRVGPGSVGREGIAAAEIRGGSTISWNPGRSRGVGVYGMLATDEGLWIGSDTDRIGRWFYRARIAFMPLAGGTELPVEYTGQLPGAVYSVGRDTGSAEQINQLVRREFDGTDVGASQIVPSSDSEVPWGNIRGAFMVDGTLYTGWQEGTTRTFRAHSFDGQTLGTPEIIDIRGLSVNRATDQGMGTGTARSPRNVTDFANFDLPNTRGMFYDAASGRLYFNTPASDGGTTTGGGGTAVRLSWRQFSTESRIVGAVRNNGPLSIPAQGNSPGLDWSAVRSMFLDGDHLFVADTSGNLTRWNWVSNAGTPSSGTPVAGSGVVVSGPGIDGEDWRARDAFIFVGEGEQPPDVAPVAAATVTCDGAVCVFDGSGSTDADGQITSYSWTFGDGATSTEAIAEHTYAASGSYGAVLTVTDDAGGVDSFELTVQIELSNPPPTATFTFECSGLSCQFDASGSIDPEDDPLTFEWNFGDEGVGSGPVVQYTYPSGGGTYIATLTVSDGASDVDTTRTVVVVDPDVGVEVAFRAVASTNVNSTAPAVVVPSSVQIGDVMVMIASMSSDTPSVTGPEGWTSLGSLSNATAGVQTHAWSKTATADDVGAGVGLRLTSYAKTALQLVAYHDASGVSAAVPFIDPVRGTTRVTPVVPVESPGSRLVSYWADKSADSTGWILPDTVVLRDQTVGTGGGLMAAAVADSGPLAAGDAGALSATSTASPNRRGIVWSIVIAPNGET